VAAAEEGQRLVAGEIGEDDAAVTAGARAANGVRLARLPLGEV
jgi:hypothetical protein